MLWHNPLHTKGISPAAWWIPGYTRQGIGPLAARMCTGRVRAPGEGVVGLQDVPWGAVGRPARTPPGPSLAVGASRGPVRAQGPPAGGQTAVAGAA